MIRKLFVLLLIALVVIQFIHPSKNQSPGDQPNSIAKAYTVPPDVKTILDKACMDCHSNNTRYPWYSKIQPVDWWMTGHINDGKGEINFDDFTSYPVGRQYRKLEESAKLVKEGKMPLNSYTWIHKDAILSSDEKGKVVTWAEGIMADLKAKYPEDSFKRRPTPPRDND